MVCKLIQADLVAYELGSIADDGRDGVEAHLLACTDCLQTYLRLKRHLAQGAESQERPSQAVRQRLRAEVEAAFRPSLLTRAQRWLTRPVPLYQGFATAALAAAVVVIAPALIHSRLMQAEKSPPQHSERIDTSRQSPENLTIY